MELTANRYAPREYSAGLDALLAFALKDSRPSEAITKMLAETVRLRRSLKYGDYYSVVRRQQGALSRDVVLASHRLLQHSSGDLEHYNGKILPVPARRLFDFPLRDSPTAIICDLIKHSALASDVEAILAHSEFGPQHRRFQTRQGSEFIGVSGRDDKRFANLVYLAHELGHCLYDSRLPATRRGALDLEDFIGSEIVAHVLERAVAFCFVDRFATAQAPTLTRYFAISDALNTYFAEQEVSAIMGVSPECSKLFNCQCECLREPLQHYPGSQIAYARASFVRSQMACSFDLALWLPTDAT
jgi:hypothetical protein